MRKESIKFIGNLKWFSSSSTKGKYSSPAHALRDHIRYILRPEECVYKWNLDEKDWGRRADELLSRNARSRIASKIVFALPNCLSAAEGAELLKEFLTKEQIFRTVKTKTVTTEDGKKKRIRERIPVRLSPDDFGFAIHEGRRGISGQRNLHAHVVFSAEHQGKKLDINRRELSELHQKWEEFLREKGYHLRKSPIRNEPHFGPSRLRYDSRARASYQHLSTAKRLWREAVETERLERMLERAVKIQGGSELLSWDEIAQEDKERREVATRGREKVERKSPPPRPRPQQQPKPVVKPKPVQQPRSVQPKVILQRPSQRQHTELEQKTKDPVKQIRKQVEKELAEKKRKEQQLAQELDYSLKQRARAVNSPPPQPQGSYSEKRTQRMEVGNVNANPYLTREVIEERKTEIYQAEMTITYRYQLFRGTITVRFRTLSNWSAEKRKGIAAFLASIAVAVLYGYKFPREALSFFGSFVEREAVSVEEQVKRVIKKPFYSSPEEALRALSVKKTIHVRVRVFENGRLVEEHNFYLMKESFTVFEKYAEAVLKRRRPQPPQPPGQGPGQSPQQPPEPMQEEPDEDYDRAPGM